MMLRLTLLYVMLCVAACGSEGITTICGDGRLDPDEECDDGNTVSGDGCDVSCRIEHAGSICGNGIAEDGEECDDGNEFPGDGCEADCRLSCRADADCDDGELCNGAERCDPDEHRCVPGAPEPDGAVCHSGPSDPGGQSDQGVCVDARCHITCVIAEDCPADDPCAGAPSCVSNLCRYEEPEMNGARCEFDDGAEHFSGICLDAQCVSPRCGDGLCSDEESAESCYEDCGACGDGICSALAGETSESCAADCPAVCGDGLCTHHEDGASCYEDCGACGHELCEGPEDHLSCALDCPAPSVCTATYALEPTLRIVGTASEIYDGTVELPDGTLVLRYERDDDDGIKEGGRVELLYFWVRYEFERSSSGSPTIPWIHYAANLYTPSCGVPPGTEPWNPAPSVCEDDGNSVPLASGMYVSGSILWDACDAHPNFSAITLPHYTPSDMSSGPGCLSALWLRGNGRCENAAINRCNSAILGTALGDNLISDTWNQPLHPVAIEPDASALTFPETHLPNHWNARAFLAFEGSLISRDCDGL